MNRFPHFLVLISCLIFLPSADASAQAARFNYTALLGACVGGDCQRAVSTVRAQIAALPPAERAQQTMLLASAVLDVGWRSPGISTLDTIRTLASDLPPGAQAAQLNQVASTLAQGDRSSAMLQLALFDRDAVTRACSGGGDCRAAVNQVRAYLAQLPPRAQAYQISVLSQALTNAAEGAPSAQRGVISLMMRELASDSPHPNQAAMLRSYAGVVGSRGEGVEVGLSSLVIQGWEDDAWLNDDGSQFAPGAFELITGPASPG